MNILHKIVRLTKRKKQPSHSPLRNQLQPEQYDYLVDRYHVNNQEKPLCNQRGQFVYLCSREDFEALPSGKKCMRCQTLLGHREDHHATAWLSVLQKELLVDIYRKTEDGSKGRWCPVSDLMAEKSKPLQASYYESLKRLEYRNIVELKADEYNRELVRLAIDCVHYEWSDGVKTYSVF